MVSKNNKIKAIAVFNNTASKVTGHVTFTENGISFLFR